MISWWMDEWRQAGETSDFWLMFFERATLLGIPVMGSYGLFVFAVAAYYILIGALS